MTSRFTVTHAPALDPGHCWITRSAQGPFIDTGVDVGRMNIERGRIYISFDALREMAREAGILDEGKSASAELKEKEWFDKGYAECLRENHGDVLNRLANRVAAGVLDAVDPAGTGEAKPAENIAGGADEADKTVGNTERKVTSTGSSKRPPRISADTGDESAYRL